MMSSSSALGVTSSNVIPTPTGQEFIRACQTALSVHRQNIAQLKALLQPTTEQKDQLKRLLERERQTKIVIANEEYKLQAEGV